MSGDGPTKPEGEAPLVGLGRGRNAAGTQGSFAGTTDRESSAGKRASDPSPQDPASLQTEPWWSRTFFAVVLLTLAQALLLVAWSSRSSAWGKLSQPPGGLYEEWPLALLRSLGGPGSALVILVAVVLTATATVAATRCVHELGGGRGAQLLTALSLMVSPLTLRLGTGHASLLALAFGAVLFLLSLIRFHRLRNLRSAGVLGLGAALVSVTVPFGWVVGGLGSLSAVMVSPALALLALAPWFLVLAIVARVPSALDSLPSESSLFADAVLQEAAWSWSASFAILGLGLPLLALGLGGLFWCWRVPGWQRPILVVAALGLGVCLAAGPTVETLFTSWLLVCFVGAVRLGGLVEMRGRVALALALQAVLILGVLTLPLGLPLLF